MNSEKSNLHKKVEISDFEKQYFIQTRQEIDTEKQERNKILNYAILVTGAFSIGLAQNEKSAQFLTTPSAFILYVPLLFIISGLIAARRIKLRQISDRWQVLYDILQVRNIANDWIPLESTVVQGLKGKRYLSEDCWLHYGLSSIVYILIILAIIRLFQAQTNWIYEIIGIGIILSHFIITLILLNRNIKLR